MAEIRKYAMSGKLGREGTPRNFEFIEREFERLYAIITQLIAQTNTNTDDIDTGGGGGSGDVVGPASSVDGQAAVFDGVTGKAIRAFTNTGVVKATAGVLSTSLVDLGTEVTGDLPVTNLDGGSNASIATFWRGDGTWDTILSPGTIGHNFLSNIHLDTLAAAAVIGDLIYAGEADPLDLLEYWADGFPYGGLPTPLDTGELGYWIDGFPDGALGVFDGAAVWQRKPIGTDGQVLKVVGGGPAWADASVQTVSASVYRSTDLDVSPSTNTAVDLSTVNFDTEGFWSAGAPSRLTVPTGMGGKYLVVGALAWDTLTVAALFLKFYVNGAAVAEQATYGLNTTSVQGMLAPVLLALNAGDYVQMVAYWELSGGVGTRRVKGGSTRTFLQIARQGD